MSQKLRSAVPSRRAFLRGIGQTMIALPLADFALLDGRLVAAEAAGPAAMPRRLVTFSFANGCPQRLWNFEQALSPLEAALRKKVVVLHDLRNRAAEAWLDGRPGSHFAGATSLFVGKGFTKGGGGGPSLDQRAAAELQSPGGSLVVGFGTIAQGVSNARRSYDLSGTPVAPHTSPRDTFDALFGAKSVDAREVAFEKSILDDVVGSLKSVTSERYGLSQASRVKLEEHLEAVRELERAIGRTEGDPQCRVRGVEVARKSPERRDVVPPFGLWNELMHQHIALLVLALECGIVSAGSVMSGASADTFALPGFSYNEHGASHAVAVHDTEYLAYRRRHLALFAALLRRMDAVQTGDGRTLLDSSIVVAGTECSDPEVHRMTPQPHLVAGGGSFFKTGGIVKAKGHTTNDLYVSCLKAVGIDSPTFGHTEPQFYEGPIQGLMQAT